MWVRQSLWVLLTVRACEAAYVQLSLPAQNISGDALYTSCGWYGLSYQITCKQAVSTFVSLSKACGVVPGSLSACPVAPGYEALSCNASNWCSGSSFQTNSSPLCLVIRAQPATSTICDVSATVETAFISPNEGAGTRPSDPGGWPVWQILTVTGAAATCLLLVLGTVLLLICCRRRTNSVASYPSSKPAGPAAPSPSPLRPSPGLGALTPTGGSYPMSAPAAYAPMYPHQPGGAYQPQPTPPAMSTSITYPPAYFLLQQPRGAGAG
ncbi:hypothetical protein V8C86DRAFT_2714242 [Haematococcus lacustris]